MKVLHAILGALLAVAVFAGALFVLSRVLMGDAAWGGMLDQWRGYKLVTIGICLGAVFLSALYALSGIRVKEKVKYLAYDLEGGGSVSISLHAMQEFLARLSDEFAQIVSLKPEVRAANGGVDIQMDVTVKAGSQIPELCRMLQDRARECIKQNVGVAEIRDIRVRVQQIVPSPEPAEPPQPEARAV